MVNSEFEIADNYFMDKPSQVSTNINLIYTKEKENAVTQTHTFLGISPV